MEWVFAFDIFHVFGMKRLGLVTVSERIFPIVKS